MKSRPLEKKIMKPEVKNLNIRGNELKTEIYNFLTVFVEITTGD